MDLTEKIAYLKGMLEGMEIDKDSKEGKIYSAIMDILTDMALTIEDMADYVDELSEQVDEIDEDLADVEEFLDDECDCDDDDCDCDCCDCDDDDYYEAICPKCGEVIYLDEDLLACDDILCPECGEKLICELDECDECDGCCDEE